MADVLLPFFILGFILIHIFLRKLFPFVTKSDLFIFLFWIPFFVLFFILIYDKLDKKYKFIKSGPLDLVRSLLTASVIASILTLYLK